MNRVLMTLLVSVPLIASAEVTHSIDSGFGIPLGKIPANFELRRIEGGKQGSPQDPNDLVGPYEVVHVIPPLPNLEFKYYKVFRDTRNDSVIAVEGYLTKLGEKGLESCKARLLSLTRRLEKKYGPAERGWDRPDSIGMITSSPDKSRSISLTCMFYEDRGFPEWKLSLEYRDNIGFAKLREAYNIAISKDTDSSGL